MAFSWRIFLGCRERLSQRHVTIGIVALGGLVLALMSTTLDVTVMSVAMVAFGPLLVLLGLSDGAIRRFFGSRALLLLGGASYALYLAQAPVREWLRLLPGERIEQVLNPLVVITLSILVFLYWEQPLRRKLRTWFDRVSWPALQLRIPPSLLHMGKKGDKPSQVG